MATDTSSSAIRAFLTERGHPVDDDGTGWTPALEAAARAFLATIYPVGVNGFPLAAKPSPWIRSAMTQQLLIAGSPHEDAADAQA